LGFYIRNNALRKSTKNDRLLRAARRMSEALRKLPLSFRELEGLKRVACCPPAGAQLPFEATVGPMSVMLTMAAVGQWSRQRQLWPNSSRCGCNCQRPFIGPSRRPSVAVLMQL
jgi:hypothetical protein